MYPLDADGAVRFSTSSHLLLSAAVAFGGSGCDGDSGIRDAARDSLEPSELWLGSVSLAESSRASLFVSSAWAVPGEVVALELEDDCGGCFDVSADSMAWTAGPRLEVPVWFRPQRTGPAQGILTVRGAFMARPLRGALAGYGLDAVLDNAPPVAVPGPDRDAPAGTRVRLDGRRSHDPGRPDSGRLAYAWSVRNGPRGSRRRLDRFRSPRPTLHVDLTGRYELELVVTDPRGLSSPPARVAIQAVSVEAVRVELVWDPPEADLDLHLVRQNGTFCDCVSSVYPRPCARRANWFSERPGANPRLETGGRDSHPEVLVIPGLGEDRRVVPERYLIAVHYAYRGEAPDAPQAAVRVYVDGDLYAERVRRLAHEHDLWMVGAIDGAGPSFEADGALIAGATCGSR